jgi:ZIP family zinc transporter
MLDIIFLSSLGLVGTAVGGILGILFGRKMLGKTLAITGGIMAGIVFFDLLPLSLSLTDPIFCFLSTASGLCLVGLFNIKKQPNRPLENTGWILLLTMALHNFPEGLAIGSSGAESARTGVIVAVTIALHDVPEGMAVATPFVGGKYKTRSIFFLTMLSGLSTVAGGVLGFWLGNLSPHMNAFCLGLAGGAMLYVVFVELLPAACKTTAKKTAILYFLGGLIIGLFTLFL